MNNYYLTVVTDTEGGKTNELHQCSFQFLASFETKADGSFIPATLQSLLGTRAHVWDKRSSIRTFQEFFKWVFQQYRDWNIVLLAWSNQAHDKKIFMNNIPAFQATIWYGDPLLWARKDFSGVAPFPKRKGIDNFIATYELEATGRRHTASYDTEILTQVILIMIMFDVGTPKNEIATCLAKIKNNNRAYQAALLHKFLGENLYYSGIGAMTRLDRVISFCHKKNK